MACGPTAAAIVNEQCGRSKEFVEGTSYNEAGKVDSCHLVGP